MNKAHIHVQPPADVKEKALEVGTKHRLSLTDVISTAVRTYAKMIELRDAGWKIVLEKDGRRVETILL